MGYVLKDMSEKQKEFMKKQPRKILSLFRNENIYKIDYSSKEEISGLFEKIKTKVKNLDMSYNLAIMNLRYIAYMTLGNTNVSDFDFMVEFRKELSCFINECRDYAQ